MNLFYKICARFEEINKNVNIYEFNLTIIEKSSSKINR